MARTQAAHAAEDILHAHGELRIMRLHLRLGLERRQGEGEGSERAAVDSLLKVCGKGADALHAAMRHRRRGVAIRGAGGG